MNIVMVNGSPKVKETVSGYLLSELKTNLGESIVVTEYRLTRTNDTTALYQDILSCDAVLFAFPVYVDAIPSHLLRFLTELEQFLHGGPCQAMVYAIVNCGFIEAKQTRLAIRMMECWCHRAGLRWGRALGVGGGEMIAGLSSIPLGAGPKTSLGHSMDEYIQSLRTLSGGETLFASPNFPRFAFQMAGNHMWNSAAKSHGLTKQDILAQKPPSSC